MQCEFCKEEYEGNYCPFCGTKTKKVKLEQDTIEWTLFKEPVPKNYKPFIVGELQRQKTKKRSDNTVF